MSKPDSTTLLLVCKQPRLNQGKQRLAATLGAENALLLARALLDCALEDLAAWPGPVVISPSLPEDADWAQGLLPQRDDLLVEPQPSGNLGERINRVEQKLRAAGRQRIIIIGSDAPVLTQANYMQAAEMLNEHQIVLSAAEDGGVTLMGSARSWPDLGALPWSSERLGETLYQRCCGEGLKVGFIPASYDIDIEADLAKLARDLESDPRPARQLLLQRVRQILPQLQPLARS